MKIRQLIPALSVIEQDLFGKSDQDCGCATKPDLREANSTDATTEMPAFIRDAIHRRVATNAVLDSSQPLANGQIRQLSKVQDRSGQVSRSLNRPVAFLLDQLEETGQCWSGWLVASEVDYATAWDVLLEAETDEPFDPSAGMVQLWNPLHCPVSSDAKLLAQMSPERMTALREIAAVFPHGSFNDEPQPGIVAPRLIANHSVLTGTPLGGADDERRTYQSLYQQLSREIDQGELSAKVVALPTRSAQLAPTATSRRKGWWMAIAASIMVIQAGVIGLLIQHQGQETDYWEGRFAGSKAERNAPPGVRGSISRKEDIAVPQGALLLVFSFKPETRAIDLDKALRELGVQMLFLENEPNRVFLVVDGPRVPRIKEVLTPLATDIQEMR